MLRQIMPAARTLLVAGILAATAAPAVAQGLSDDQKNEVRSLVRETLMANPEILMEAMQELRKREADRAAARRVEAMARLKEDLLNDPTSPVLGNPNGDVTVVEFTDYNCGYCKMVFPFIQEIIDSDPKVRVVIKEFPVIGATSMTAARAALAAGKQGKYAEMHAALMQHKGQKSMDVIEDLASGLKLDVARLKKDMADPAFNQQFGKNAMLADELEINGTPAFIVGDQVQPGAASKEILMEMIAKARRKS